MKQLFSTNYVRVYKQEKTDSINEGYTVHAHSVRPEGAWIGRGRILLMAVTILLDWLNEDSDMGGSAFVADALKRVKRYIELGGAE